MSYQLEVDMIRKARQMGLLTTPYVFNVEEAKLMTEVSDATPGLSHTHARTIVTYTRELTLRAACRPGLTSSLPTWDSPPPAPSARRPR
jgi:hypothetical protein